MQEVAVHTYDDLWWAEEHEKVAADGKIIIGIDGQWYELDATTAHIEEARRLVERYALAGHKMATPPSPHAAKVGKEARNKPIREWALTRDEFKDIPSVKSGMGVLPRRVIDRYLKEHQAA